MDASKVILPSSSQTLEKQIVRWLHLLPDFPLRKQFVFLRFDQLENAPHSSSLFRFGIIDERTLKSINTHLPCSYTDAVKLLLVNISTIFAYLMGIKENFLLLSMREISFYPIRSNLTLQNDEFNLWGRKNDAIHSNYSSLYVKKWSIWNEHWKMSHSIYRRDCTIDFDIFVKLAPLPFLRAETRKNHCINIAIFIICVAATFTFSILETVDECIFVLKLAFLHDWFFSSFIPDGESGAEILRLFSLELFDFAYEKIIYLKSALKTKSFYI